MRKHEGGGLQQGEGVGMVSGILETLAVQTGRSIIEVGKNA